MTRAGLKVELDREVIDQLAELANSEAFMQTIEALCGSQAFIEIEESRGHLRAGDPHNAIRHEARAGVWEDIPAMFRQIREQRQIQAAMARKGR